MLRRPLTVLTIVVALAARVAAQPANAQYDEAKVPAYTLPDPLRFEDGRAVTSAEAWRSRRAEIVRLFETHVYGRSPAAPSAMRFVVVETTPATRSRAAPRAGRCGCGSTAPRAARPSSCSSTCRAPPRVRSRRSSA